jgi:hypothetical protein
MSSEPSCTWYGRPKWTGWALSGLSPSLNVLWSTQTFSLRRTDMRSNWEFQLPASPSFGDQAGKQSNASTKLRLRTITLLAESTISVRFSSLPPRWPTIVVFGPTLIWV